MNAQTATLLGLGCPDCAGSCLPGLAGEPGGEEIFDSLKPYLLTAKSAITFYSKPPGDWFPLVNNELTIERGRLIGGVSDYKIVDEGLWLKATIVSPSWFLYDSSKVDLKPRQGGVVLSQQAKDAIIADVVKTLPGGDLLLSAGGVVKSTIELTQGTLDFASKLIRYLPWIAVTVGGVIVYVKYGDDIKKAFSKPEKPKLSGVKKSKKVIHI